MDDELRLAVTEKLDILTLAGCFIDVQDIMKAVPILIVQVVEDQVALENLIL